MRSSPLEECFDKIQRMVKPIKSKPPTTTLAVAAPTKLLNDLRALISQSRQQVAQAINSVLVMLYWQGLEVNEQLWEKVTTQIRRYEHYNGRVAFWQGRGH